MDHQTKVALKQDQFVSTTHEGLEWASENRSSLYVAGGVLLAVILVVVLGVVFYNSRSEAASSAFGNAMAAFQTPVAVAGQPVPPGVKTYTSVVERAKAANALFLQVADKYGMTPGGRNALYFAGLTDIEAGDNQKAEDALKKVSSSWDSDLAALAKMSLADLYRTTGRPSDAIALYNQLAAKPTNTVPAGLAKLQLADLYKAQGNTVEARKIYAEIKDKDPKSITSTIANEKLNPSAAPAGQGLQ